MEKEFAYVTARKEIECPKCKAKCGERCKTPKGKLASEPHNERMIVYIDKIGLEEFNKRHSFP
jgi:hypothetical protein